MTVKKMLQILFPAGYGLLVYATVRLLQDTESGFHFWTRPWQITVAEILLSILVGYIFNWLIRWLCRYHDLKYLHRKKTSGLLLKELGTIAVINLVLVNSTFTPMASKTDDGLSWGDFTYINVVPLLYMLIYFGYLRSSTYLKTTVEQAVLVEKLTNDRLATELKFLKAQYHPHFLFNALNTVYFQMDEDVAGAKQSLEKLSGLLRYQLYDQQQQVTMRQELDHLGNFIALQRARSSKQLQVSVTIDQQLELQKVYPLLFLPLVENAFKFTGTAGSIEIYFSKDGDFVNMISKNSIPEQAVKPAGPGGIGLENLQRRLDLLYPGNYTFTVSNDKQTFTAAVRIPFV